MLQHFSRIIYSKSICRFLCINLVVLFLSYKSNAQSLGDPIVNITFGAGVSQFAGPMPPSLGTTDYTYVAKSPEDNFYTIANSTVGLNKNWVLTTDHTGDPNGYMMIVNASYKPGLFYTGTVMGLCGSTTYQFSAFIKNIMKAGGILPNVTFTIESLNGVVLGKGNTNDINPDNTWREYPFTFTTPANMQTVILKMANNAPGGGGNDIAIDDITFRPYGTSIKVAFNQADTTFCASTPQTITITTTTPLDANFSQKLQGLEKGIWVDKGPAGTAATFSFSTPTTAGKYAYRVIKSDAGNINTPTCVVSSNVLNIIVQPIPKAAFLVADTTCQGDTTVFKDQSTAPGSTLTSWLWKFGDGQTAVAQNPSHVYTNGGDYIVTLTVTNKENCAPSTITKPIHIIPKVNIAFNIVPPYCATNAIAFKDGSTSIEGNIISRKWDYGDSIQETKSDSSTFFHVYAKAGTYPVTLTIKTDKGCVTTLTKIIKVNPLPVVDFDLPDVCYADLAAKFVDKTTIADNSSGFKYKWNFGDDAANINAGNLNTSNQQNPSHYYGKTKQYQVSLTVTSADGCTVGPITKTLQVNGSPVPDFVALNSGTLCANREVFFENKSHATIGKVTKLVWYFDTNDLSIRETDNDPYPGKLYRHIYPAVHFPQQKRNVTVRIVAYTGDAGACQIQYKDTITLLATPTLSFNPPDSVCLNNGPVNLGLFANESTGIPGAPVYSGTGVTGSAFDPTVAGVGTFAIKCVYTTTAVTACADTITRNITVKPLPTVNAGPNVTILAGGATTLHATATGDNLKYSWLPVLGLSNSTIPDPVVTVSENTTYTLTVTNGEGCSVTGKVTVTALQLPVIPNTFTPNGDGINDTWNIKYLDTYTDCTVNIFNRNGQKIYSSIGYTITGWDGKFSGNDLPVGVYYYIINPKHGRKPVSGYVTIIR